LNHVDPQRPSWKNVSGRNPRMVASCSEWTAMGSKGNVRQCSWCDAQTRVILWRFWGSQYILDKICFEKSSSWVQAQDIDGIIHPLRWLTSFVLGSLGRMAQEGGKGALMHFEEAALASRWLMVTISFSADMKREKAVSGSKSEECDAWCVSRSGSGKFASGVR